MAEPKKTTTRRRTNTARKNPEESKLTAFYEVNDWWHKHNIGTRTALIVFISMYIIVVLTSVEFTQPIAQTADVNGTQEMKVTVQTTDYELVKITGYFAFAAFLVITLGENALSKIGDIIVKYKEAKKG